jgi:hypothetical protein
MKPLNMSPKSGKKIKPAKPNNEVSLMIMHRSFWARRLYRGYVTPKAEKTES